MQMENQVPNELGQVFQNNGKDFDAQQKIVERLLDNDNLETKTELSKPISFATLHVLQIFLSDKSMSISSEILRLFAEKSFTLLISKDRKGRTEYVEALKSLNSQLNQIQQQPKLMEH